MKFKDFSIRSLIGKTMRDPVHGTKFTFLSFTPDPESPDSPENEYLGSVVVLYEDGSTHEWFGSEIEMDFACKRLEEVG